MGHKSFWGVVPEKFSKVNSGSRFKLVCSHDTAVMYFSDLIC